LIWPDFPNGRRVSRADEFGFVEFIVEDGVRAELRGEKGGDFLNKVPFLPGKGKGDTEAFGAHGAGESMAMDRKVSRKPEMEKGANPRGERGAGIPETPGR
jgi:hypothetical protein